MQRVTFHTNPSVSSKHEMTFTPDLYGLTSKSVQDNISDINLIKCSVKIDPVFKVIDISNHIASWCAEF